MENSHDAPAGRDSDAFAKAMALVKGKVPPKSFDAWFGRLGPAAVVGDEVRVHAPGDIPAPDGGRELVTGALEVVLGRHLDVEVRDMGPTPPRPRLNEDHTFGNYVVGPSNRFAHAAALAVARSPGREYNPLFIHSGVGLGKTHLLHAACRELCGRDPWAPIICLSCDEFVGRYLAAMAHGDVEAFRRAHRSAKVLVIDDIHFLADKVEVQEEFFHTFNALVGFGAQVILSSDSHPSEIPTLEERLVSRFVSGLVAKIEPPQFDTRMEIVKRKAAMRGIDLPDDVASEIAKEAASNVREVEGFLNTVVARSELTKVQIDAALVRDVLGEMSARRSISKEDVAEAVAARLSVRMAELQSKRRTKHVANARHIAMYLCRKLVGLTLAEIGHFMGGRDHSTVLYACDKVADEAGRDQDLQRILSELEREALSRAAGRR